jgi:hypothetical protein
MDATLEANERNVSVREAMSVLSGLAVLSVLVAVLAASTFITSSEGAGTPSASKSPPHDSGGSEAIPSTTFYLFDSEARLEEIRGLVELAEDQVGQIPLQTYPRAVSLLARTPDQEALAYARIVDEVRSSNHGPVSIEVLDLRAHAVR